MSNDKSDFYEVPLQTVKIEKALFDRMVERFGEEAVLKLIQETFENDSFRCFLFDEVPTNAKPEEKQWFIDKYIHGFIGVVRLRDAELDLYYHDPDDELASTIVRRAKKLRKPSPSNK